VVLKLVFPNQIQLYILACYLTQSKTLVSRQNPTRPSASSMKKDTTTATEYLHNWRGWHRIKQ